MPKNVDIPQDFADLIKNPQRIRDAMALLNALANMEVHLVPPANVSALSPGNKVLRGDPPVITLPLPRKSPSSWAAATGTATRTTFATTTVTTAQLAERVKALIDDLQTTKVLPSS